MTRGGWVLVAVVLYAIGAICTFGHAMNRFERWSAANCATVADRWERGTSCYGPNGGPALAVSLIWPLYLSFLVQADD